MPYFSFSMSFGFHLPSKYSWDGLERRKPPKYPRLGIVLIQLEQQKQLPLTHWRRDETEAPVERIRVGVDRVRQHRANARLIGNQ